MSRSLTKWFTSNRFVNSDNNRPPLRRRRLAIEPLEQRHLLTATMFNAGGFLSSPSSDAPMDIVVDFLNNNAADLGLASTDLQNYIVTDQYASGHNGVTHIYLQQTYDGLPVAGATINANVTADGRVLNVGSSFVAGLDAAAKSASSTPLIAAAQALEALAADFGWTTDRTPAIVSAAVGDAQETVLSAAGVSRQDVPGILQVHGYGGVELRRAPGLGRGVAYSEAFGAKRPLFAVNFLHLAA